MKKKFAFNLIVIVLLNIQMVSAQLSMDSIKIDGLKSFLKVKVGADDGFEWEQQIGKASVIALFSGITVGQASDSYSSDAPYIIVPSTYIEYRNYYNIAKRTAKHKNNHNNASNFLYGRIETYFPIKNQNYFGLVLAQGWGAQRSLFKRINMDCHLGIMEHVYYDKPPNGGFNYLKLEPAIYYSLSYVF